MSLTISEYSDRCFVLRGDDTKKIKEDLMDIGGKFNSSLNGGPGWIVGKRTEKKLMELLSEKSIKIQKISNQDAEELQLLTNIQKYFSKYNNESKESLLKKIQKL